MGRFDKVFERRTLTTEERTNMKSLYAQAKIFAEQADVLVPNGLEKDIGVFKIREALGFFEAAVAANPKHYDNVENEIRKAKAYAEKLRDAEQCTGPKQPGRCMNETGPIGGSLRG